MIRRSTLFTTLIAAGLALAGMPAAHAAPQSADAALRATPAQFNLGVAVREARDFLRELRAGRASIPARSLAEPVAEKYTSDGAAADAAKATAATRLVGTWRVTVPGPTPAEDFFALQTFDGDGILVETSSLLGTLVEGPAHGVWAVVRGRILSTFELFAFDEAGAAIGRIRVRNQLELDGANRFVAHSKVDVLPFGEEPILEVAAGDYFGERMPLVGP